MRTAKHEPAPLLQSSLTEAEMDKLRQVQQWRAAVVTAKRKAEAQEQKQLPPVRQSARRADLEAESASMPAKPNDAGGAAQEGLYFPRSNP